MSFAVQTARSTKKIASPSREAIEEPIPERHMAKSELVLSRRAPSQPSETLALTKQLQTAHQQVLSEHHFIQQKQQEVSQIQQMSQSLQEENDQLQAKYRQSKHDLLASQEEVVEEQLLAEQKLREQADDFSSQFAELQGRNKKLKLKVKEYEALTAQLNAKIVDLSAEIGELEEKTDRHKQRYAERYERLQEEDNALKAKLQRRDDEMSALQREMCEREIAMQKEAESQRQKQRIVAQELENQVEKLQSEIRLEKESVQDQITAVENEAKAKQSLMREQSQQEIQTVTLKVEELEELNMALKANLAQTVQNSELEQDRLRLMLEQREHELEINNNQTEAEMRKKQSEIQLQTDSIGMEFQVRQSDMEKQFNAAVTQYNMRVQEIQASCDLKLTEERRSQVKLQQEIQQLKEQAKTAEMKAKTRESELLQAVSSLESKNRQLLLEQESKQLSERQSVLNELKKLEMDLEFVKSDLFACRGVFQQITLPSKSYIEQIVSLACSAANGLTECQLIPADVHDDDNNGLLAAYQEEISVLNRKLELLQEERRQNTQNVEKEALYENQQLSNGLLAISAAVEEHDSDLQQAELMISALFREVSRAGESHTTDAAILLRGLQELFRSGSSLVGRVADVGSIQQNWLARSAVVPQNNEIDPIKLLDCLIEGGDLIETDNEVLSHKMRRLRSALEARVDFAAMQQSVGTLQREADGVANGFDAAIEALSAAGTINTRILDDSRIPGTE